MMALYRGFGLLSVGGPIFEILSRSVQSNQKSEKHKKGELRALKTGLVDQGKEIKKLHDLVGKMGKEIISLKELSQNQIEVHEQDRDVGLREEISSLKPDGDVEWESTRREANKDQAAAIRFLMTKNLYSNSNKQPMNVMQNIMAMGFLSHYNFNDLDMTKKCPKSR